jgi:hypothetical protein
MEEINSKLILDRISKDLINGSVDIAYQGEHEVSFSNKNIMIEQYKLLVDSSHKIEERRGASNSVFIGINTILVSVLANSPKLIKIEIYYIPFIASLGFIGILISYDWLKVINSYKKLNFLNYALIQSLENFLPSYVFSLRAKLEAEEPGQKIKNRGSSVLMNEKLLPKVFLSIYFIYFLTVIIIFFYKIYF